MPDRDMTWQTFQVFLPERVRNQTNIREITKSPTISCRDARALLSAVLQGVQPVERHLRSVAFGSLWEVNSDDSTLVVGIIGLYRSESWSVVQGISPRGGNRWRTLPL